MHRIFQHLCLLAIALLVLSLNLVQCRNAYPKSIADRQRTSLTNIDYINICMFRKSRLCDFLREMNARANETKDDRETWKRGVKRFYSNW